MQARHQETQGKLSILPYLVLLGFRFTSCHVMSIHHISSFVGATAISLSHHLPNAIDEFHSRTSLSIVNSPPQQTH
ncbi:hypothetical protein F5X99DRAFT_383278 [Biscogniauxia marginata]|nr:hypothetical protein F5X99DRAFT_383278 [Biscogniauxia marginata]